MGLKIVLLLIIAVSAFARFEVREDYVGRFKRAVVSTCKDWFEKITDKDTKDFYIKELPNYEGVSIKIISNNLIKVQLFEDEDLKVQGEMMFLDGMPAQFVQRTFEERGFYPKAVKEDL